MFHSPRNLLMCGDWAEAKGTGCISSSLRLIVLVAVGHEGERDVGSGLLWRSPGAFCTFWTIADAEIKLKGEP